MKTRQLLNGVVVDVELPDYTPTPEEIREQKLAEIADLKAQLAESDFMVIKDWEAEKLGLPLPYTPEEIHAVKQPLRDRINELESEVNDEG